MQPTHHIANSVYRDPGQSVRRFRKSIQRAAAIIASDAKLRVANAITLHFTRCASRANFTLETLQTVSTVPLQL